MLERDAVQALLGELGGKLGVRLSLDDDGVCAMTYGDGAQVVLQAAGGSGCLVLHAPVADVPPGGREAFYVQVLKLNLLALETGGFVLGLDEAANRIELAHAHQLDGMDFLAFENLLANFVDRADRIRLLLAAPAALDREVAGGEEPGYLLHNLGLRA